MRTCPIDYLRLVPKAGETDPSDVGVSEAASPTSPSMTPCLLLSPVRRRLLEARIAEAPDPAIARALDLDRLRREAFTECLHTAVFSVRESTLRDRIAVQSALRRYRAEGQIAGDPTLPDLDPEEEWTIRALESYTQLQPLLVSGWPKDEPLPIEFQERLGEFCAGVIFPFMEEGRELFLPSASPRSTGD